jgi:hypothetical protein
MRDLRNGSIVKNVTRASARKLWHYAISAKEANELDPSQVRWQGDIGLWRKTLKGGAMRFDLVQRRDNDLRVFYGVTEDGIHGAWRRLIEAEERQPGLMPVVVSEEPALPAPMPADGNPLELMPPLEPAEVAPVVEAIAELEIPAEAGAEPAEPAASPARRGRGGTTRKTTTKKAAAKKSGSRATKKVAEPAPRRRRKPAASDN